MTCTAANYKNRISAMPVMSITSRWRGNYWQKKQPTAYKIAIPSRYRAFQITNRSQSLQNRSCFGTMNGYAKPRTLSLNTQPRCSFISKSNSQDGAPQTIPAGKYVYEFSSLFQHHTTKKPPSAGLRNGPCAAGAHASRYARY